MPRENAALIAVLLAFAAALLPSLTTATAAAQESPGDGDTGLGDDTGANGELGPGSQARGPVGPTASALPGFHRVGAAALGPENFALAGTAGYGFTESQTGETGSHHRIAGTLGVGLTPTPWLGLALRLDGRYDAHPDDAMGSDNSLVGDPRILLRVGDEVSDGLSLGGQLTLWLPGQDAPSVVFAATSVEAALLATYRSGDFAAGFSGGYRLDQSAASVEDPDRLRPGDRIALGLSDFDAVVLGLGASYRVGQLEVLGEVTWDVLLGDGAPGPMASPLRAAAGVRYGLSDALSLELMAEATLSERPDVGPGQALVSVEPRVMGNLGLRYVLPLGESPMAREADPVTPTVEGPSDGVAATASLRGRVVDGDGAPLANAQVSLAVGERSFETTSDMDGAYSFENLPAGSGTLTITAEGFEPQTTTVELDGSSPTEASAVQLVREIQAGQLRGLIRSFRGEPIVNARIRVSPGDFEARTDAEGRFEVELPPGAYEVDIAAGGYSDQQRSVEVEENGVTVLNADMRRGR